jgi:signal transduction histidine kinase
MDKSNSFARLPARHGESSACFGRRPQPLACYAKRADRWTQRTTPSSGDLAMSRRQISYREMESYLARARRERAKTIAKLLRDGVAHGARALARAVRWSAGGGRAAARISEWRRRRATGRERRALDDRQPKGIGAAKLVATSPTAAASDDVAHALRTPLTSIRSFSEILRDNPDLPRVTRERFLGIVLTESQRLDRAIEQLLHVRPPA